MNAPTVFGSPVHWPAKINEIPKDIFDREDVFRLELERIFYGPEWHPVAHTGEIPNIGDFKTFHIGERPLLVVHGQDGGVRVFYNACAHRGTLLETTTAATRQSSSARITAGCSTAPAPCAAARARTTSRPVSGRKTAACTRCAVPSSAA